MFRPRMHGMIPSLFRDNLYCPECAQEWKWIIEDQGQRVNKADSNQWPVQQLVYETEQPRFCYNGEQCPDSSDGRGAFLETQLTETGKRNLVNEYLKTDSPFLFELIRAFELTDLLPERDE